ncbi:Prolyl-tRNA synthetase, bacterial type [hydrothermal vent metagenome]|uniref:proline--tRNA ligase n=1 Tax=hydrothermal vent metagenome TaxID=652676 RepID=A0A3B1DXC8_9ZZZZ
MKFSKSFIPTTKENPSDAVLPSHKFLVRGGFINQQGAGLYNYLPLGKIVLEKIRAIIKEELDNAGCHEVQLSFVTPISLWDKSGRANTMGKEMLRIADRHTNEFVLSPTNEEAMVEVASNRAKSYKDLPLNLYQINTKFRDEARPRYGLLRGREFLMKDGYSFHTSKEDMIREFNLMEKTYKKILTRLGLDFRVVNADSGEIGGTGSKEFHVLANSGEDTIVMCEDCEYGANIETIFDTQEQINDLNEKSYIELKGLEIYKKCVCGSDLHFKKGIEVGHIFQLGDKYSKALDAKFQDENGKPKAFEMATFGIGVSRLVASVIEQNHDENGCIWTNSTTPYMVDVIVSKAKSGDELNTGLKIYKELKDAGISTIIDDRNSKKDTYGFKIGDFKLLGFPYAIVVGKKLQDGLVELIDRKTLTIQNIKIDEVVVKLTKLL